jgi:hypothetical protein
MQQVLMECIPNCTLREACFICDSTSVPTTVLAGTISNASSSFYILHLPQAMYARGTNVPISLTLWCTTADAPAELPLIRILTLVFFWCSSSISISKAVHNMHISILCTSILCISLRCYYFSIGNNVSHKWMQYELYLVILWRPDHKNTQKKIRLKVWNA